MTLKLLIVALLSVPAFAENTAGVTDTPAAGSDPKLPKCVDNPATIQRIKDKLKTYKNDPRKYDGYRDALAVDSKEELFARLLYAETLAATALNPEASTGLHDQIGSQAALVIGNRVRKCGGNVNKVVFQRDQFASSMNNYTGSLMLGFLCPTNRTVWNMAYRKAVAQLAREESSGDFNYYLYKHKEGWDTAPWNYPENKSGVSAEVRSYIKIFTNPSWKCSEETAP